MWYPEPRLWLIGKTVQVFIADKRKTSYPADTAFCDAYPGYESLLCGGKDKMEWWLSTPLLEASEAVGKSRAIGKQLYSGNGNRDDDEADGDRFISLGETETRAPFPISPKTLVGETYAESL